MILPPAKTVPAISCVMPSPFLTVPKMASNCTNASHAFQAIQSEFSKPGYKTNLRVCFARGKCM
jgi:hypothetical protein